MSEEAVRQRLEDTLREVEGALEDVRRLVGEIGAGNFDEDAHNSAKERLRAALAHLESLRPQRPVHGAGAQT